MIVARKAIPPGEEITFDYDIEGDQVVSAVGWKLEGRGWELAFGVRRFGWV